MKLDTLKDIELLNFGFPYFTVYQNPKDFPEEVFVARLFNIKEATPYFIERKTLEEIRADIPEGFFRMNPSPEDDPVIVEIWI